MRIHDGAYGTLLQGRLHGDETVDDLCLREPPLVVDAHLAYLEHGATAIQTNSFLVHLRGSDRRRRELRRAALACAREAVDRAALGVAPAIFVTIGPASDEPRAFWEPIEQALENGATGVVCETVTSRAGADAFLAAWTEVAAGVDDVEVLLGCSVSPSLGAEAMRWVVDLAGDAPEGVGLGLNCCEGPTGLKSVLDGICERRGSAWVMPSAGVPTNDERNRPQWPFAEPDLWAEATRELVDGLPIAAVGGCCGTTPEHVERFVSTA